MMMTRPEPPDNFSTEIYNACREVQICTTTRPFYGKEVIHIPAGAIKDLIHVLRKNRKYCNLKTTKIFDEILEKEQLWLDNVPSFGRFEALLFLVERLLIISDYYREYDISA